MAVLLCTWNRIIQTLWNFWHCDSRTAMKMNVVATCLPRCGFQICLWNVLRLMASGVHFVRTRVRDSTRCTVMNIVRCICNTKPKVDKAKHLMPCVFGKPFTKVTNKVVYLTCATKTMLMPLTCKTILALLLRQIFACLVIQ